MKFPCAPARFVAVVALFAVWLLTPVALAAAPFEGKIKMAMDGGGKDEKMTIAYAMKGQRMRVEIPTGEGEMVSLVDWDKREMSMLMPGQQMYMVVELKDVPMVGEVDRVQETATLEKTAETATIVGRKATKYLAREGKNVTELWLAEGLGSWFNLSGANPMKRQKLSDWEKEVMAKGLFPLRMVSYDKKGKKTMQMDVVELTPQKLGDELFAPPAGYTRFSMGGLLKGLGGGQ